MEEFTQSELIARREHSNRFPEAQSAIMEFTNDEGDEIVKVEVEYEWEPVGCGEAHVTVKRPVFKEGFNASDENVRIDIADQVSHRHRIIVKIQNVYFL